MNDYQRSLVAQLRTLTTQDPPAPWQYVTFILVGGLEAVGFGEGSDVLLIVSSDGRGVVDCLTGEKVARDYTEAGEDLEEGWYRPYQLLAEGIGPLAGQSIQVAGIVGGGLPTSTRDGWYLELAAPDWPNSFVLLHTPVVVTDERVVHGEKFKVAPRHSLPDVVLTYGFSPTGTTFVVAYSHGVEIFKRTETG